MVTENERWHPLFTEEELAKARKRLAAYGYGAQKTSVERITQEKQTETS